MVLKGRSKGALRCHFSYRLIFITAGKWDPENPSSLAIHPNNFRVQCIDEMDKRVYLISREAAEVVQPYGVDWAA